MLKKNATQIVIAGMNDLTDYFLILNTTSNEKIDYAVFDFPDFHMKEQYLKKMKVLENTQSNVKIKKGANKDFSTADILIITAFEEREVDEEDKTYLKRNIQLFRKIINQAMENGFSGKIIVATTPTEVFTYLAWKFSGLPKEQIIGMGTFGDTLQFQHLLSKAFNVSANEVRGFVVGGSLPEQKIFVWSRSYIGNTTLLSLTLDSDVDFNYDSMYEIEDQVIQASSVKTNSNDCIQAVELKKLIDAILGNERIFSSVTSIRNISATQQVAYAYPVLFGENGIENTYEINLSDAEAESLDKVIVSVRQTLDEIENGNL